MSSCYSTYDLANKSLLQPRRFRRTDALFSMQYHQTVIHSHRPWMSKRYIQPDPPQGNGYSHARRMCIESAAAIARLLRLYERQYSLSRINIQAVPITCSAALILIVAGMAQRRRRAADPEITAHVNLCFRALEEFGGAWKSAERAQRLLVELQQLWELQIRSSCTSKRTESSPRGVSHFPTVQSKRTRISDRSRPEKIEASGNNAGLSSAPDRNDYQMDLEMMGHLDWLWTAMN
jgi:hypothetical protein